MILFRRSLIVHAIPNVNANISTPFFLSVYINNEFESRLDFRVPVKVIEAWKFFTFHGKRYRNLLNQTVGQPENVSVINSIQYRLRNYCPKEILYNTNVLSKNSSMSQLIRRQTHTKIFDGRKCGEMLVTSRAEWISSHSKLKQSFCLQIYVNLILPSVHTLQYMYIIMQYPVKLTPSINFQSKVKKNSKCFDARIKNENIDTLMSRKIISIALACITLNFRVNAIGLL